MSNSVIMTVKNIKLQLNLWSVVKVPKIYPLNYSKCDLFYYKRSRSPITKSQQGYSKNPHKRTHFWGVQADFVVIYIGCFLQNQPEMFLRGVLKIVSKN